MASLNDCNFIGNLGDDPTIKYVGADTIAVARFSIALSKRYKNRAGETVENTVWVSIECWRWLAEFVRDHLHKGTKVFVKAEVKTEKWKDNDGKDRYTTKFVASDIIICERMDKTGDTAGGGRPANADYSKRRTEDVDRTRAHKTEPQYPDDEEDYGPDIEDYGGSVLNPLG